MTLLEIIRMQIGSGKSRKARVKSWIKEHYIVLRFKSENEFLLQRGDYDFQHYFGDFPPDANHKLYFQDLFSTEWELIA